MKKLRKTTVGLVTTGVALGVGTSIVAGAGGSTAALATVGGFMPAITTGVMGKYTLDMMSSMYKKKKKRR